MAHGILLHEPDDDVGVAVRDLRSGDEVGPVTLEGVFVTNVKGDFLSHLRSRDWLERPRV